MGEGGGVSAVVGKTEKWENERGKRERERERRGRKGTNLRRSGSRLIFSVEGEMSESFDGSLFHSTREG